MYNLYDIFYEDNEYPARAEWCNENKYVIVEIEPDINGRRFQIQELQKPTQNQLYAEEMYNLKKWFNDTYTYQEQKFRRLIALNKTDDDGISAETKLNTLYEQAEINRVRIQELEQLLNIKG